MRKFAVGSASMPTIDSIADGATRYPRPITAKRTADARMSPVERVTRRC
jgi:hypothetical protein